MAGLWLVSTAVMNDIRVNRQGLFHSWYPNKNFGSHLLLPDNRFLIFVGMIKSGQ